TASNINWVNDTPGIGFAASGAGNIAPFTAINTGTTPVMATITATPAPSGFAYIPNSNDGTLSVVNTVTNKVVKTITLGSNVLPFGVSVSPDGSTVYVTDRGLNNVLVINTSS